MPTIQKYERKSNKFLDFLLRTNPDGTKSEVVGLTGIPGWEYLGEETVVGDGTSNPCVSIPVGTNVFSIATEGVAGRYTINSAASANSGGYVGNEHYRLEGPLTNLTSIETFQVAPGKMHFIYYKATL